MKDEDKTKEQLTNELVEVRQRINELETSEIRCRQMGKESEAEKGKLHSIVNSITTGMGIVSYDYKVLFQNKFLLDRFGDIKGKLCYKEYMNRDKPCSDCSMRRALENNKVEQSELIGADGRNYELVFTPIKNPDGTMSAVEVVTDITERKREEEALRKAHEKLEIWVEEQTAELAKANEELRIEVIGRRKAEEALRESEEKLDAMLRSIGHHMSMLDKDLNIIWANETAKKVFGSDIVGKKCYEVYHRRKEPCEPYPCLTLKAFQDGRVHEHDTQVIAKDGKIIYFHCTANVALRNKQGKTTAVIEISRDITELKRAQEALEESEEKYRNLFENANDAIFVIDTKTGIILDANKQAEQLIGHSKQEIIGMHQSRLHPPDYAEYYKNKFHKYVQKCEIFDLEAEVIKRDGIIVPVFISVSLISLHGKEVIQAVFRDITKEKRFLDLKEKMAARKLIEKAKGILMDRYKISEKEAMRRLQKESRRQRKKIKEIAQGVIKSESILN